MHTLRRLAISYQLEYFQRECNYGLIEPGNAAFLILRKCWLIWRVDPNGQTSLFKLGG